MAVQKANYINRDWDVDGVPSSGPHKPVLRELREWGTWVEDVINAGLSNGGLIYTSQSSMNSDLAHLAGSSAWVIGDSTVSNNGIYRKSGGSGSGSWTKVADLPYSYILASATGSATEITATTSIPVPAASGAALIALPIPVTNSGPITVSFNSGTALSIVDASGNALKAGDLRSGAIVAGYVSGSTFRLLHLFGTQFVTAEHAGGSANAVQLTTPVPVAAGVGNALISVPFVAANTGAMTLSINGETPRALVTNTGTAIPSGYVQAGMRALVHVDSDGNYRLLSYGDASAIQAAAEAARDEAVDARDAAIAAVSSATPTFSSKAFAEAYQPAIAPDFIRTAGYSDAGDGGGALYKKVDTDPDHAGKLSITLEDGETVVWYEIAETELHSAQFGVKADWNGTTGTDDGPAMVDFLDALRALKRPGKLPKASIYVPGRTLDISGIDLTGVFGGFLNREGTQIVGDGTTDVLVQQSVSPIRLISHRLRNIRVTGAGGWGVKLKYAVLCHLDHVYVEGSEDGISLGDEGTSGPLFNNITNCWADVDNVAFQIVGTSTANANLIENCFFRGDGDSAAIIDAPGGIRAVSNVFVNVEIAGDGCGLEIRNARDTKMVNPYFESLGPSIKIDGLCGPLILDGPVFAGVRNDNKSGKYSFIWHKSGSATVEVNGGFVYNPDLPERTNITFVQSDAPSSFTFKMPTRPNSSIGASGFVWFDSGLTAANLWGEYTFAYTPTWAGSSSNPSIGNGTLTGRWSRQGNLVTVSIALSFGSTSNAGSGDWTFSLPFAATSAASAMAYLRDAGTAFYAGIARVGANSSLLTIFIDGGSNVVGATKPFSWANGDSLELTISYLVG